jgi:HPt (histidine-containing phosphotransfer) domain-containing protein
VHRGLAQGRNHRRALPLNRESRRGDLLSDVSDAIDLTALDELARLEWSGRPGFMDRVIKLFLETALECVTELRDASASGDLGRLHRACHALKPCSATVGAAVLSAHCEELEAMARTGALLDAAPRVLVIEQEYQRAAAALRSRIGEARLNRPALTPSVKPAVWRAAPSMRRSARRLPRA